MDGMRMARPQKRRRLTDDDSAVGQLESVAAVLTADSLSADPTYTYLLPAPIIRDSRREQKTRRSIQPPMPVGYEVDLLRRQASPTINSTTTTTTTNSDGPLSDSTDTSSTTTMSTSTSTTSSNTSPTTTTSSESSTTSVTTSSTSVSPEITSTSSFSSSSSTSSSSLSTSSNTTSPSSSITSSSSSSTFSTTSSTSSTSSSSSISTTPSSTSTSTSSTTTSSTEALTTTSDTAVPVTRTTLTTDADGGILTITMVVTPSNSETPEPVATTTSKGGAGLATSNNGNNNSSTPPAGTIAGGVVGGAAGLAVIVLIAMLFIRWYRRKGQAGHRALPPGAAMSSEADESYHRSQGPGMAERAGLMPLPTFLRHHHRSVEDSEPSERGFRVVSGHKLPSAFSEGMSSAPSSSAPLRSEQSRNFSAVAPQPLPYRDNIDPFYGGPGDDWSGSSPTNTNLGPGEDHELMTMSPGPERTPNIQYGGAARDYYRPPRRASDGRYGSAPGSATRFTRSDTSSSVDPSRNSRFTEEM